MDGKLFVYSEEQGRVVQHRRGAGAQASSRWTSLESVDIGSVSCLLYLEIWQIESITTTNNSPPSCFFTGSSSSYFDKKSPVCFRMSPCQSRLEDHRMLETRLMELERMVELNREAVTRNTRELSSDTEASEDNM